MKTKAKKKQYIFEFDITGTACIYIQAENDEDAVKKLKESDDYESSLNEWDFDYPDHFDSLSVKDMMKHCAGVDEDDNQNKRRSL